MSGMNDALLTLDKENIRVIEFTRGCSGEDMVAVFNIRKTSEKVVLHYLKNIYPIEVNQIIVLPKKQFEFVFGV